MKLIVKDTPGLDGEYPDDISRFTNNEGKLIKRLSGVRMGEILEALKAGDNALLVAIAVVILARHGHDVEKSEAILGEADMGGLDLDFTDETVEAEKADADARPPDSSPTKSGPENEPVEPVSEPGKSGSSGVSTTNGSDPEPAQVTQIGSPPWDTGSLSAPGISAS